MIFYLMNAEEWDARGRESTVAVPESGGFVHCCAEHQIGFVRESYFPPESPIVALGIDPTALVSETCYELGSAGEPERFPHVYGSIQRRDVLEVRVL